MDIISPTNLKMKATTLLLVLAIALAAGELTEPVQNPTSATPFKLNGYTLTPVADYEVKAQIAGRKN
jgi:hypothetical protein